MKKTVVKNTTVTVTKEEFKDILGVAKSDIIMGISLEEDDLVVELNNFSKVAKTVTVDTDQLVCGLGLDVCKYDIEDVDSNDSEIIFTISSEEDEEEIKDNRKEVVEALANLFGIDLSENL